MCQLSHFCQSLTPIKPLLLINLKMSAISAVLLFCTHIIASSTNINSETLVGNLVTQLIINNYSNCFIVFISTNKNDRDQHNLREKFNFFEQLSLRQIPYNIHNNLENSMSRRLIVKFTKNDCDLVIIQKQSFDSYPENLVVDQLDFIRQLVFPHSLHQTRLIFLPWYSEEYYKNSSNLYLKHDSLQNIPLKMEIKLVRSHSSRDRALLLGLVPGSGNFTNSSSNLIIGGFDDHSGYRTYTKLFPETERTTLGKRNVSLIFPLAFFIKHKIVRPKLAFSQLMGVLYQTMESINLTMDGGKGGFVSAEPVGADYHREVVEALDKKYRNNSLALAIIFFIDEPNPYHLQTSKYYTYYRSTLIYRKVEQDKGNLLNVNFKTPVIQYLIPLAFGAAIIISLSQKWDLVSKARLPKPVNGEIWMRRCRKLRM